MITTYTIDTLVRLEAALDEAKGFVCEATMLGENSKLLTVYRNGDAAQQSKKVTIVILNGDPKIEMGSEVDFVPNNDVDKWIYDLITPQITDIPEGLSLSDDLLSHEVPKTLVLLREGGFAQYTVLVDGNIEKALEVYKKLTPKRFAVIYGDMTDGQAIKKALGKYSGGSRIAVCGKPTKAQEQLGLTTCEFDCAPFWSEAKNQNVLIPQYVNVGCKHFMLTTSEGKTFYKEMCSREMAVFKRPRGVTDEQWEQTRPQIAIATDVRKFAVFGRPYGIYPTNNGLTLCLQATMIPAFSHGDYSHITTALMAVLATEEQVRRYELWVGAALMRLRGAKGVKNQALLVVGKKNSGKTEILLGLVKNLVGQEGGEIPATFLSGQSKFTGDLDGSGIWYADDAVLDSRLDGGKVLGAVRKIVASDTMSFERKGQDFYTADITSSLLILANPEKESCPLMVNFPRGGDSMQDKGLVLWIDDGAKNRLEKCREDGTTEWTDLLDELSAWGHHCEQMANNAWWKRGRDRWIQDSYYPENYLCALADVEEFDRFYLWLRQLGLPEWFTSTQVMHLSSGTKAWNNINTSRTMGRALANMADHGKNHISKKFSRGQNLYKLNPDKYNEL